MIISSSTTISFPAHHQGQRPQKQTESLEPKTKAKPVVFGELNRAKIYVLLPLNPETGHWWA